MIRIRPYSENDFQMICSWWDTAGEVGPKPGMMINDGTFVLELDGIPSMSLTIFMTQSKEIAYLEGYIARPGMPQSIRRELGHVLFNYVYDHARSRGYRRLIGFSAEPKLITRYQELGLRKSLGGLQSLVKEL